MNREAARFSVDYIGVMKMNIKKIKLSFFLAGEGYKLDEECCCKSFGSYVRKQYGFYCHESSCR